MQNILWLTQREIDQAWIDVDSGYKIVVKNIRWKLKLCIMIDWNFATNCIPIWDYDNQTNLEWTNLKIEKIDLIYEIDDIELAKYFIVEWEYKVKSKLEKLKFQYFYINILTVDWNSIEINLWKNPKSKYWKYIWNSDFIFIKKWITLIQREDEIEKEIYFQKVIDNKYKVRDLIEKGLIENAIEINLIAIFLDNYKLPFSRLFKVKIDYFTKDNLIDIKSTNFYIELKHKKNWQIKKIYIEKYLTREQIENMREWDYIKIIW